MFTANRLIVELFAEKDTPAGQLVLKVVSTCRIDDLRICQIIERTFFILHSKIYAVRMDKSANKVLYSNDVLFEGKAEDIFDEPK